METLEIYNFLLSRQIIIIIITIIISIIIPRALIVFLLTFSSIFSSVSDTLGMKESRWKVPTKRA